MNSPFPDEAFASWLEGRANDRNLLAWAEQLLFDLCSIDTSLGDDLVRLREAEQRCFDTLLTACQPHLPEKADIRRVTVHPSIAEDPRYTVPYYAGQAAHDAESVYRGRASLLLDLAPNQRGERWLLNGHVDTVPPHLAPTRLDGRIDGRGAADNKGGVVAAVLAARLVTEWTSFVDREMPPLSLLASIDEEMGGNGSLGALKALDLEDGHVVVLEPTELRPYPANRGATWFSIEVEASEDILGGVFRDVGLALAASASTLRQQSRHPLFVPEDVSFCLGIAQPFGGHPASACDRVDLVWPARNAGPDPSAVALDLARELRAHKDIEHDSADPTVERTDEEFRVAVHAIPGHMGSHDRDTDAIAKAAVVIDTLERVGFGLPHWPARQLHIEGGQGFLPDRTLEDVQDMVTSTVDFALTQARARYGGAPISGAVRFDKLHNDAYASAPGASGPSLLAAAIGRLRRTAPPPLTGWKASCDARLFRDVCDDVVTFGPGRLEDAHGPGETVSVRDVAAAAAAVALAVCS